MKDTYSRPQQPPLGATSQWTVDTLHAHFIQMLRMHEAADLDRHQFIIDAAEKATSALNVRLNSMNQFRAQLADQAVKFITRNEIEVMLDRLSDHVDSNRRATVEALEQADRARNAVIERLTALSLSVQQAAADANALFLPRTEYSARHEQLETAIEALRSYRDRNSGRFDATPTTADQIKSLSDQVTALRDFRYEVAGRGRGLNQGWVFLVGGIGLLSTIITIALAIYTVVHK